MHGKLSTAAFSSSLRQESLNTKLNSCELTLLSTESYNDWMGSTGLGFGLGCEFSFGGSVGAGEDSDVPEGPAVDETSLDFSALCDDARAAWVS